jgi:cytochrome c
MLALKPVAVAAAAAASLSLFAALVAEAAPQPKASASRAAPLPGNATRGAALYDAKCGACHSLDANRVGPAHRGVFGRKAGQAPGFAYSPALKGSNIVWTTANLDRWLSGPTTMVPGAAMGFRLASPQDRADVIAYLRTVGKAR